MEQKKYKVTIGIPVYNAERYISKCLQSVFDQTIDDIELLLIDDKGNDNSMSVARQMIANNPNGGMARIVEHEKNMGVANARNTIVREAKGKYLFFMDSDDYLAPNSIELLYNKAEETGAETVWGSTLQVDSETGKESVFWSYPDLQLFGEDELINYEYEKEETRLLTVVWNILFHTEFLPCYYRSVEIVRIDCSTGLCSTVSLGFLCFRECQHVPSSDSLAAQKK